MSETARPGPEHFLSLIRRQQRGRLKVYLGFAPGVGKTFEMLQEAHRLKRQGVDVVAGIVETHDRPETASLLDGLGQVPRRRIEYRGVALEELDTEALLTRRPEVVLVDELAHSNAPGTRHAKRWQDVEELLQAGIHVVTTMNVQHLESLYDLIEGFTGVKVKERVPDYVLHEADQIVNVDLPAEDLQERLRAGKVYPAERIERALSGFFQGPNLSRLRELALEEVACALDKQRRKKGEEAPGTASERVMVCLSSRGPDAPRLLRKGARLADRLNAPWYAVYIRTPGERLERVDAATQRRIADALALAQQLGGVPQAYSGPTVAGAIASFVSEYGITHLVMGRSRRPWWRRWFGQSAIDQVMSTVPGADILVIGSEA
ncbi:MAG: universal stress protein [Gemmataceae bacterium]|nr:universal stress protein [Gemmataceae bacterium]